MLLPNSVIAKVENIGKKKNQGQESISTNRCNKPFGWTGEVQEDDSEFQSLLEQDEAPYPDISAEHPGIKLERNQTGDQTDGLTNAVEDDHGPDF